MGTATGMVPATEKVITITKKATARGAAVADPTVEAAGAEAAAVVTGNASAATRPRAVGGGAPHFRRSRSGLRKAPPPSPSTAGTFRV